MFSPKLRNNHYYSAVYTRFQDEIEGISRAVKNGHHVFIAGEHGGTQSDKALPRIIRDAAEEALLGMGLPRDRAGNLATLARRSLPALRRKLASEPTLKKPDWAQPQVARVLLAPLLASTWQDHNKADREILARLAGTSYEQLQENVVLWSKIAEPPLRLVGGIWMMAAPEDAWRLLAPFLTSDDTARFKEIALEVLSTRTSSPPTVIEQLEQLKNATNVETSQVSSTLREGIASTLALMTALSSQVTFVSGSSGEETARSVIRSLFDKAKFDAAMWASFAPMLMLLAEAAPIPFLDAVDAGLIGETPFLRQMFYNQDDNYGFGPTSPHTFLLWALETLSWNPALFGRAVLCLSHLARIDPGGKNGNRASSSLRETFVIWYPNTTVSLNSRLQVLDTMRKREPAVAWALMLQLLPTIHGGVCHPLHGPKWHDWKPDEERRIPNNEIAQTVEAIIERLLSDAGTDASRWCQLIARTGDLWPQLRGKLLDKLDDLDPALFQSEEKVGMVDALRAVIIRHREFPDAASTMPKEHLVRLDAIEEKFEPNDPVLQHRWRFQRFVPLPERREMTWQKRDAAVTQLRSEALQEILTTQGWEGVLRLASQVEDPHSVGFTLSAMPQPPVDMDAFLAEDLASPDAWRATMASGWVRPKAWQNDQSWLKARHDAAQNVWCPEQWGEFYLSFPFTAALLDPLGEVAEEAQLYYWHRVQGITLPDAPQDAEKVIERLLWANCSAAAIQSIHWALSDKPDLVPLERIMDVLEAALTGASAEALSATHYDSAELLNHLAKTDAPRDRLALLEWQYFGLHEYTRSPKILYDELSRDPGFFVEVLSLIYSARPGETETDERKKRSEPSEESQPEDPQEAQSKAALARRAYSLLLAWHQIPGIREDRTLDEEHLKNWVSRARELASECERSIITLLYIGHVVAHSPQDEDGAWPHRAVRDIIEEISNTRLDSGFHCQVVNNRGVTSRGLTDGGAQERILVEKYEKDAAQIADSWPRTASVLRGLADNYRQDAEREDSSADLTQDFWR